MFFGKLLPKNVVWNLFTLVCMMAVILLVSTFYREQKECEVLIFYCKKIISVLCLLQWSDATTQLYKNPEKEKMIHFSLNISFHVTWCWTCTVCANVWFCSLIWISGYKAGNVFTSHYRLFLNRNLCFLVTCWLGFQVPHGSCTFSFYFSLFAWHFFLFTIFIFHWLL